MGIGRTKEVFADSGTRFGAVLTGCKNIVEAKKIGAHLDEAPAWGVTFEATEPVGDDLCAIGVRAYYFSKDNAAGLA